MDFNTNHLQQILGTTERPSATNVTNHFFPQKHANTHIFSSIVHRFPWFCLRQTWEHSSLFQKSSICPNFPWFFHQKNWKIPWFKVLIRPRHDGSEGFGQLRGHGGHLTQKHFTSEKSGENMAYSWQNMRHIWEHMGLLGDMIRIWMVWWGFRMFVELSQTFGDLMRIFMEISWDI